MVLTTFYCISVLGQTNLIEQLSEGLAKQFIKLDVISGIKQELRPLSVLVFFTCTLPRLYEISTNKLAAAGRLFMMQHFLDDYLGSVV